MYAAAAIADCDDVGTGVTKDARRMAAGVAEALYDDAGIVDGGEALDLAGADEVLGAEEDTTRRSRIAAWNAAEVEGLAGDHGEAVLPGVHHLVGVEDPRHRLSIGIDVGGGDVGVWSNVVAQRGNEAPGDPALLVGGEVGRITGDPSLGSSKGDVD